MYKILGSVAFVSLLITACATKQTNHLITSSDPVSVDTAPGSCPYLAKAGNTTIAISWVKQVDTSASVYCFAISTNEGKSFSAPIIIPGSTNVHPHGENLPKIIFKPSGEIIAAWGAANPNPKNLYSGLVYYSQSFDNGKTWTQARSLTTDTASFDQRYFDMALLPNGEAGITWLDNRKQWDKEGSGLYFAETSGKSGFVNEHLISGPCCQCCRTDLFIDSKKNFHVVYRAIINDSIRDMVHITSTDGGKTFNDPQRISQDNWVVSGCPHTGPAITENSDGLQFAWFTGGAASGIYYNQSANNGKTFTPRQMVSGKASKHCQVASLTNNDCVIVWNESFQNGSSSNSRIGIQQRNKNGDVTGQSFITDSTANSSFPVIYPVSQNKAIVAYTENINGKDHVLVKQVTIE